MAGKRKAAAGHDQTERRVSPRVQEMRQKALDEKERIARERVKFLSEKKAKLCVDDTKLHASDEEAVHESPKRRSPPKLTAMQKGKQKLDMSEIGYDDVKDAHLQVTKCLRFFNKQYLLMVQVW